MAKIRTIKPELFRHEDLFEAEQHYHLPLRLAFMGLFTCCDREGRFRWKPRQLKLDVLPYDDVDFYCVLAALEAHGFIKRYEKDGECYGYIPSWNKHQTINVREPESKLPTPNENEHVQTPSSNNALKPRTDDTMSDTGTHVCAHENHVQSPLELEVEMEQEQEQEQEKKISMSGKPDLVSLEDDVVDVVNDPPLQKIPSQKPPDPPIKLHAVEILQFLNEKTGRAYRPVDANLKLILARLKSGASVADCYQVIAKKTREWRGDAKMVEYLRPATLFNATKFEQYVGELVIPQSDKESAP